jgi:hypothetical protein
MVQLFPIFKSRFSFATETDAVPFVVDPDPKRTNNETCQDSMQNSTFTLIHDHSRLKLRCHAGTVNPVFAFFLGAIILLAVSLYCTMKLTPD